MHNSKALKNAAVRNISPSGEKGGIRVEKRSISLSGFPVSRQLFLSGLYQDKIKSQRLKAIIDRIN
jgi:hypothetical protein